MSEEDMCPVCNVNSTDTVIDHEAWKRLQDHVVTHTDHSMLLDTKLSSVKGEAASAIVTDIAIISELEEVGTRLKHCVDEIIKRKIATVRMHIDSITKLAEAHEDVLTISIAQLQRGCTDLSVQPLLELGVPKGLLIMDETSDVISTLSAGIRILNTDICPDKCVTHGSGLEVFVHSILSNFKIVHKNKFVIECYDALGNKLHTVNVSDVTVSIVCMDNGVHAQYIDVKVLHGGDIFVHYGDSSYVTAMAVKVMVYGVVILDRVIRGIDDLTDCVVERWHVPDLSNPQCILVSDDEMEFYVLDGRSGSILVTDSSGSHVRTLCGDGSPVGRLYGGVDMCWIGKNILVAERYCNQLHEITTDGEHVRLFFVPIPTAVCAVLDRIIVGCSTAGMGTPASRVICISDTHGVIEWSFECKHFENVFITSIKPLRGLDDGRIVICAGTRILYGYAEKGTVYSAIRLPYHVKCCAVTNLHQVNLYMSKFSGGICKHWLGDCRPVYQMHDDADVNDVLLDINDTVISICITGSTMYVLCVMNGLYSICKIK
jgi:hypothetical protein